MIELANVTKRYGNTVAVDDLSFEVNPGEVTGFLGPNGAGKSTAMRMIMGLTAPSSGRVTIHGRAYRDLRFPLRHVGALLDAKAFHPGRTARDHLRWTADSNGINRSRVDEVLGLVGLSEVAGRRLGEFSLGMGQRLGIAGALIGDPGTLVLDEPVNGLDPEGIQWIRQLLRSLAQEGRAVLVSSHLMSEMAQTADRVVVIGQGRLIAQGTVDEIVKSSIIEHVRVDTAEPLRLLAQLAQHGADAVQQPGGTLTVSGVNAREIGILAAHAGITLYELTPTTASLEAAFFELTRDATEHRAQGQPT